MGYETDPAKAENLKELIKYAIHNYKSLPTGNNKSDFLEKAREFGVNTTAVRANALRVLIVEELLKNPKIKGGELREKYGEYASYVSLYVLKARAKEVSPKVNGYLSDRESLVDVLLDELLEIPARQFQLG